MTLVARTHGDPMALASAAQRAVWDVDGDLAVSHVLSLEQAMEAQLARPRVASVLVAGFGVLALILATSGIYGVVAFDTTRRTREIGLRLALGARTGSVIRLVLARGLSLVAIGLALGLASALVLSWLLRELLFDVSVRDPLVYLIALSAFVLIGVLASLAPALRAAHLDPVLALQKP